MNQDAEARYITAKLAIERRRVQKLKREHPIAWLTELLDRLFPCNDG